MSIQKRNGDCPPPDNGCDDCKDKDNATQKSITTERMAICTLLYETEGNVEQQQTKFDGENEIFNDKKCMFLHTEENYRRYRNLEICVGTELLQTNSSIKTNVANLTKLNTDLNKVLTDITKQIKDAKSKFADLKYASCKLDDSITDKCNAAQWKALTGKVLENCNEDPKQPIDPCKNTESEINSLICLPKGLGKDIDYIFQSSADVTGIQMFSNIDTLDPLQKTLSDKSNAFEKLISDTMKTRKGDLDKLQTDLVDSVKAITQSAMDRNSMRSDFEGYYDTTKFLCCPTCNCVTITPANQDSSGKDNCKDECNPRLQVCGNNICGICKDVQVTFCCDSPNKPDKKCD
jgi:gas vesicle protein